MNREYVIMIGVCLSALLYALGGTGFKWARRYILPLILATMAILMGVAWYRAIGVAILAIGAFSLGYGTSSPIFQRILTLLAHGLCLAPLITGPNAILMLLPPLTFGLAYYFSRKFGWLSWKLVELANGGIISASLVMMCLWR